MMTIVITTAAAMITLFICVPDVRWLFYVAWAIGVPAALYARHWLAHWSWDSKL